VITFHVHSWEGSLYLPLSVLEELSGMSFEAAYSGVGKKEFT